LDINSTLLPILTTVLDPIESLVKKMELLVGGVFGLYLIGLYIRWKEYSVLSKAIRDMRHEIRVIAEKQGITLEPIKEQRIKTISHFIKEKLKARR